ncbi:MAG: hypothetical protein QM767_14190 [Anaeromyxobacter sp.]
MRPIAATTLLAGLALLAGCSKQVHDVSVGGTVAGLEGTGLQLSLGAGAPLSVEPGAGTFQFPRKVRAGREVTVSVVRQPSSPWQACAVVGGTFTPEADVTELQVICATSEFRVGGTVAGLRGAGLVLQNAGGDDLAVGADGAFTFPHAVPSGATFTVSVASQPSSPSQTCAVSGGSGTIGNGDVASVLVNCSTDRFTLGGTVTGLAGAGLVLRSGAGSEIAVGANGSFAFPEPLLSGTDFDVTVAAQPIGPWQTCAVAMGQGTVASSPVTSVTVTCASDAFALGGVVSGLDGEGLVLVDQRGNRVPVAADGLFSFPALESGADYAITVAAQPTHRWQACTVEDGTGTMAGGPVSAVTVTCATQAYSVGGIAYGVDGLGLVLRSADGQELPILSDGSFAFPTAFRSGDAFDVWVSQQPTGPWQTCTLVGGQGLVGGGAVTTLTVNCTTDQHTVGGVVNGLAGSGLQLSLGGLPPVTVGADGGFSFPTLVPSGAAYEVSIVSQPTSPWQTCAVTRGSGAVAGSDVTDVAIDCTTDRFTVGGTVSGLAGAGLVLRNGEGDDLVVGADGAFTFASPVDSGQPFAISVATQPTHPWQTCTVSGGSGIVGGEGVTGVAVHCTTNTYAVSGTISGLAAPVVLQNGGGDDLTLTASGAFRFPAAVASGGTYDVTVLTQPTNPWQTCTVSGGSGPVTSAEVADVAVTCVTHRYAVGGTVSGLSGSGLVLQGAGGETLPVPADGGFTFPTTLESGSAFEVTVAQQPTYPWQHCAVSGGTGTVGGADVGSITVNCQLDAYAVGGRSPASQARG